MDKIDPFTRDLAAGNFRRLAELFPEAVTETIDASTGQTVRAVDAEALRAAVGAPVLDPSAERYRFTWPDKRKAIDLAFAPTSSVLRPVREKSVGRDGTPGSIDTENLYIEGDNLEALKILRETYLGRVKMIYIDPPYNTGHDFVYEDDFSQTAADYAATGGERDETGNRLVQNTEASGRFHTDWLNMIYPRLRLAKDFLSDDGVIFISIDDNEVANLRKICDEIFGPHNFVAQFVWAAGRKNDSKHVSVSHEYIVCYFRNVNYIVDQKIVWRERKQGLDEIYAAYDSLRRQFGSDNDAVEKGLKAWYRGLPDGHPAKDHSHYCNVDEKGIFFADNISWPGGGGPKYEVLHPVTGKPVAIPSRGWLFSSAQRMKEQIDAGRVLFGDDETGVPTLKAYLREREDSVPYSVFYKDGRAASKRLKTLLGDKVFENPKDEEILKRLIDFSGTGENDIVMDFFSGSGTTAHALFLAEAEKPLHRRFILVQLPEVVDPEKAGSEKAKKVARNAIAFLDSIGRQHTICDIGEERIRRAGKKILEKSSAAPDVGFRVFRVDSANMRDVRFAPEETRQEQLELFADNVKEDRTAEDLLAQAMLSLGVPLSKPVAEEAVEGRRVFSVDGDFLVACFERDVPESVVRQIARRRPVYAVLRDASLGSDATMANFDQIFAAESPETVRRVL